MRLSILICTLFDRCDNFAPKVMRDLLSQKHASKHRDMIQLVSMGDDAEMSVGEKRNRLMTAARGQYVCYVDDDDTLVPDFIEQIFEGMRLAPNADVYNYMVAYSDGMDNKNVPVYYSLKYPKDNDHRSEGHVEYFERLPNHLMVIRNGIASSVQFPEIDKGEDTQWAQKIRPQLKTEYCIPKVLYYYNWNRHTTVAQAR